MLETYQISYSLEPHYSIKIRRENIKRSRVVAIDKLIIQRKSESTCTYKYSKFTNFMKLGGNSPTK